MCACFLAYNWFSPKNAGPCDNGIPVRKPAEFLKPTLQIMLGWIA